MRRVLVTGASGFIGRPLVLTLARGGWAVLAASRKPPSGTLAANIEYVKLPDLEGRVDWRRLLDGIDAIVHLAGMAHDRARIAPDAYDRINHLATARLADSAAVSRAHLVFVSSVRAQVGFCAPKALTENDPPSPTDAYGRSKLAAEEAVRRSNAPYTILRPVVVYGARAKGNFEILRRVAKSRVPLPLLGLTARRSVLSVDSLVEAICFVLLSPQTRGQTYLVADQPPLTLAEIVAALRQGDGRPAHLIRLPSSVISWILRMLGRDDFWQRIGSPLIVDAGKLASAGWRPIADSRGAMAALASDRHSSHSTFATMQ